MIELLLGTLYGLLIGIIPSAGATTGLVALYGFMVYFPNEYSAIIFIMATVAASTTADTLTAILLGIPGANSAAATIQDGYPLAKRGKTELALSAAITSSTLNGLIWGIVVFLLLDKLDFIYNYIGSKELWIITLCAFLSVILVLGKKWYLGVLSIILGIMFALVGTNPITNATRYTFGWEYLEAGIQLMPLVAGIFAIPQIIDGITGRAAPVRKSKKSQKFLGIYAVWKHLGLSLRGGLIGAIIGFLPGLGGAVSDWIAYGHTVSSTKNPKIPFGKGNIRGIIGPEGSNNAQKATSMITTVLFGIPGASFAAVVMGLLMYLNVELGDPSLFYDTKLFNSMLVGYLGGTILVAIILFALLNYVCYISQIKAILFYPPLVALLLWSCSRYTGGWEDYAVFIIFSLIGYVIHRLNISKPALLLAFILFERFELLSIQLLTRYIL
jgi:putative tricarboxylic transport membrane protein